MAVRAAPVIRGNYPQYKRPRGRGYVYTQRGLGNAARQGAGQLMIQTPLTQNRINTTTPPRR